MSIEERNIIVKQLEASFGNRELDGKISQHDPAWSYWKPPHTHCPKYTTSVDAALVLIPAGWHIYNVSNFSDWLTYPENEEWVWHVQIEDFLDESGEKSVLGVAKTFALALCIAILKAQEMENGNNESYN